MRVASRTTPRLVGTLLALCSTKGDPNSSAETIHVRGGYIRHRAGPAGLHRRRAGGRQHGSAATRAQASCVEMRATPIAGLRQEWI